MDQVRLQQCVVGRLIATDILGLIHEEVRILPEQAIEAFWDALRSAIPKADIPPISNTTPIPNTPMSDAEVAKFEMEIIPFGHKDMPICDVDLLYLNYLAGLTFIDQLRRYLKNERVAKMLAECV